MTQTTSKTSTPLDSSRSATKARIYIGLLICITVLVAAITIAVTTRSASSGARPSERSHYLGLYDPEAPGSYAGIDRFANAIGGQPNLVSYYSSLTKPFQVNFATLAAEHGAITLDQIGGVNVPLGSIISGQYDKYLRTFADEVKAFPHKVILSFDHEMNGGWYSWGYRHTSPHEFVAAWRHIVNVFRRQQASNVIWMWTVNVINTYNNYIPDPAPWWPGKSYVDWVGIDGYYYTPSWNFASLFGPTIADVRKITNDPILVAETGAAHSAGQSAKIADLFAGVRTFGLLGFLWFDMNGKTDIQDWRINSPAAVAAFRREAEAFMRPQARQTRSKAS